MLRRRMDTLRRDREIAIQHLETILREEHDVPVDMARVENCLSAQEFPQAGWDNELRPHRPPPPGE